MYLSIIYLSVTGVAREMPLMMELGPVSPRNFLRQNCLEVADLRWPLELFLIFRVYLVAYSVEPLLENIQDIPQPDEDSRVSAEMCLQLGLRKR